MGGASAPTPCAQIAAI
ncbi:DUF6053 domain-containing protein [Lysobacter sp. 2RAB21]